MAVSRPRVGQAQIVAISLSLIQSGQSEAVLRFGWSSPWQQSLTRGDWSKTPEAGYEHAADADALDLLQDRGAGIVIKQVLMSRSPPCPC